jgi:phage baseplate assembly protein W
VAGLAPELPIRRDDVDGYRLIKSFKDLAQQNFKMLVLTAPGERIMDPEFGVGLRNYFFEQKTPSTYGEIESRIRNQVAAYLPYIKVMRVQFMEPKDIENALNLLSLKIEYFVKPLQIKNTLSFDLDFTLSDLIL